MVKITEDKLGTLTENIEKGLRYVGKAMQCLDELTQEGGYGERSRYGHRTRGYDNYGMRDDFDPEDMDVYGMREDMGMRRGVRGTGRYSRY